MDPTGVVEEYYRCLDEDDYGALRSILHPAFSQRRPDRTFEDPDAFVSFMAEDRPVTGTTHEVDHVLESNDSVAAAGRLVGRDGAVLFAFIDVFVVDDAGRIRSLVTHS